MSSDSTHAPRVSVREHGLVHLALEVDPILGVCGPKFFGNGVSKFVSCFEQLRFEADIGGRFRLGRPGFLFFNT